MKLGFWVFEINIDFKWGMGNDEQICILFWKFVIQFNHLNWKYSNQNMCKIMETFSIFFVIKIGSFLFDTQINFLLSIFIQFFFVVELRGDSEILYFLFILNFPYLYAFLQELSNFLRQPISVAIWTSKFVSHLNVSCTYTVNIFSNVSSFRHIVKLIDV